MQNRRPLTLSVAVPLTLVLGACSSDGGADDEPYKASIGSNERTETTDALGFAIVVDGEGNGRVVGTLINSTDNPQTLVGADVRTERGPAKAVVVGDQLELPPDEPVELAREAAVAVSAPDLPVGFFVELTLDIEGGEPVEMLVPVEAQKGPYAEIEVTAPPDGDVAPRDRRVRVRGAAASVNPADWRVRSGQFRRFRRIPLPFVPGRRLARSSVSVLFGQGKWISGHDPQLPRNVASKTVN